MASVDSFMVTASFTIRDREDCNKVTELDKKLDKILRLYADIDPEELGEDKFTGHHSVGMARDALKKVIDQVVVAELGEILKAGKGKSWDSQMAGSCGELAKRYKQLATSTQSDNSKQGVDIESLPEKMSDDGSLQEHELIAMIDLGRESLVPRKDGTLIFREAELHNLVVKLIAEYHNKVIDDIKDILTNKKGGRR